MGAESARRIGRVFDPDLSVEARRRLLHKAKWYHRDNSSAIGALGVVLSIIWVIVTFILHFTNGLPWAWLGVVTVLGLASYVAYRAAVGYEPDDVEWKRVVESVDLDESDQILFSRAQRAVSAALRSGIYATDAQAGMVEKSVLRRHEWEIATALRDITRLRRKHTENKRGESGPITATVLSSQERALMVALTGTESRISALERYAEQLKAADSAKRDWERALKLSGANDEYLDLVARTAADEHAVAEINDLTEQAKIARQTYQESLHEVALAAEALSLPHPRTDPSI
jgi:hypothetical protein